MEIWHGFRWFGRLLRRIAARAGRANLGLIAAGVAFFGLFAVFPAMTALVAIFGLVADPEVVAQQFSLLSDVIPPQAYYILKSQVDILMVTGVSSLTWATVVSIAIALWSARAGVSAMVQGINAAYGAQNRGGVWHVVMALFLTLSLIVLAVVAMLMVVVTPIVMTAVDAIVPIPFSTTVILELVRWAVALLVMLLGLGLLYRYGPNMRGNRPGWITPGAVAAIVLWFVASVGFSLYLAKFANFSRVYGSLGAVIAMQLWLYISAFLVLLGATLNVELRAERQPPLEAPARDE